MQLLTFSIAGEPFAIEARLVIEVLPLVPARPIPQVPDYVLAATSCRSSISVAGSARDHRFSGSAPG